MDSSVYSLPGAAAAFLLAWLTAHALRQVFGAPPGSGRFESIDGLRGFLAFSVFLHHGVIWFVYLRTGLWQAPQSGLFRQFGDSAVALFFMITSFLFTTKVLNSRERPLDWLRLFVGRLTRLLPMYLVAVAALFVMVWQLTRHRVQVDGLALSSQLAQWAAFTIRGAPDVNGLPETALLIAAVTWSLPYEWWFYVALPFLALLLHRRPPLAWLLVGALSVLTVTQWWLLDVSRLLPFAGGILSAGLVRYGRFRSLASRRLSGLVVVCALAATVKFTATAYTPLGAMLLTVAFAFVSAGNTMFGLLSSPTSRLLGEVTCSMYLIHGLVLTLVFRFTVGMEQAAQWSVFHHWLVIVGLSAPLVLLSYAGFRLVELPGQRLTNVLLGWLRPARPARANSDPS